jgi:hypothetical protein
MRPLSARSDAADVRDAEDDGGSGAADDGLRSSVTCTSDAATLGEPHVVQKRAVSVRPLPQWEQ